MALARARVAARRTKDKWKAKNWYKVNAPAAFNNVQIAETLSDEPSKLDKRTVEATLQELTGDMKLMHVKITFQVNEVVDNTAKTEFVGHTMTSDYIRRLVRRGNSKIPAVVDLVTQDGSRLRVKPFAVTDKRCQTTQNQEIRRIMTRMLQESAASHNLSQFLHEILVGDLNNRMFKEARKVHPVRRVEIAKSEMVTKSDLVDETPIFKVAAPVEETTEGAAEAAVEGEVVATETGEDVAPAETTEVSEEEAIGDDEE